MQPNNLSVSSLRVIIIAMMVGIAIFGGVAIMIGASAAADPGLRRLLPIAPVVLVILELPAYFVVRATIIASNRRQHPKPLTREEATRVFAPVVLTIWMIAAAMAEGVAFFALVAFLLTGVWWTLALPAAALIVLALLFPSAMRLEEAVKSASGQMHA